MKTIQLEPAILPKDVRPGVTSHKMKVCYWYDQNRSSIHGDEINGRHLVVSASEVLNWILDRYPHINWRVMESPCSVDLNGVPIESRSFKLGDEREYLPYTCPIWGVLQYHVDMDIHFKPLFDEFFKILESKGYDLSKVDLWMYEIYLAPVPKIRCAITKKPSD